VSIYLSWKFWF